MHPLLASTTALCATLLLCCRNSSQPAPALAPEDVLIKWQAFIDQDLYDSARLFSTGQALAFVGYLDSLPAMDDGADVSITLLRDLVCTVTGDSALCAYVTKDEIGQDIPDTVILRRIKGYWLVSQLYASAEVSFDSLTDGNPDFLFPPEDSSNMEYQ